MEETMTDVRITDDDLNGRFLTFYIGETVYGIELLHVIEIIQVQPITPVPNVAFYNKGIINLRGKIVPVIDVRLKLNQPEIGYDEKTCIIVVTIEEMQVGLIVDSVSEVATVQPGDLAAPPELNTGSGNQYLSSIAKTDARVILNLDCNKFFASDLNITGIY